MAPLSLPGCHARPGGIKWVAQPCSAGLGFWPDDMRLGCVIFRKVSLMKSCLWALRCLFSVLPWACFLAQGQTAPASKIFPEPREIEARSGRFALDPSVPL